MSANVSFKGAKQIAQAGATAGGFLLPSLFSGATIGSVLSAVGTGVVAVVSSPVVIAGAAVVGTVLIANALSDDKKKEEK